MGERVKNTKRNIVSGLINRIISILLPFLIRTAILYILGAQYMGLNSLFTSVLQVLNLAELGFSSAIVFSMYKPIADNDTEMICALMNYYKKVYSCIGTGILVVGLAIVPVITKLINGSWPSDINIYLLYLIYLFNTVLSYFLYAYKSALLNAVQRIDIVSKVQLITLSGQYILQLLALILFKNYYCYILITPISTIACNLITAKYADRLFPEYQCKGKLDDKSKKSIYKQISGLMLSKLSDTSRNSFDSIVLSTMFGLTTVAIYNNYYYIYNALYGIMLTITQAMQASVGNSIAAENVDKNYVDLRKFSFLFAGITSVCVVCMLCIYQPFMKLWAGNDMLLSNANMILFCLYFYLINMNNSRNLYFSGNGLWWKAKTTFIAEAVGNLVLNITLGIVFGITGVLLATIFTIFVFNFVVRTNILFREYFKISPKKFYMEHFGYAIETLISAGVCYYICSNLTIQGIVGMILRGIICVIIASAIILICNIKNPFLKESLVIVKKMINK